MSGSPRRHLLTDITFDYIGFELVISPVCVHQISTFSSYGDFRMYLPNSRSQRIRNRFQFRSRGSSSIDPDYFVLISFLVPLIISLLISTAHDHHENRIRNTLFRLYLPQYSSLYNPINTSRCVHVWSTYYYITTSYNNEHLIIKYLFFRNFYHYKNHSSINNFINTYVLQFPLSPVDSTWLLLPITSP